MANAPHFLVLARFGAIGIGGIILGGILILAGCQSSLIYFPRSYPDRLLADAHAAGVIPILFETTQGKQVAHFLPHKKPPQHATSLWMITAGNGSLALDYLEHAMRWQNEHPAASFLFVDYPGYGDCQGHPDPSTITENLRAAHNHLTTSEIINQPIHLGCFGHSLGAAAALIAAEQLEADRVILVSPFTSMTDMAEVQFGKWAGYILRHHFDNRARMQELACRDDVEVIIFHGKSDRIVPAEMSEELARSHPKMVSALHLTRRAGHNSILKKADHSISEAVTRPFSH